MASTTITIRSPEYDRLSSASAEQSRSNRVCPALQFVN
ncbi:hypothetical protein LINPERPRIM_LOCUS26328 [Linum perenne]